MINVDSVHCHGFSSCYKAKMTNIKDGIWMYGYQASLGADINGVANDLHFGGTFSCYACQYRI